MKTTIYELLGMIKDGKAPKKILFEGETYIYNENNNLAYCYTTDDDNLFRNVDELDELVEILDEEDKIEKCIRRIISHNFCITDDNYQERFEVIRKSIEDNANEIEYTKAKINELIDKVNKCTK